MDYRAWPENGCGLAQARERTADRTHWRNWQRVRKAGKNTTDKYERRINAQFSQFMQTGKLVAYAQSSNPAGTIELVPSAVWSSIERLSWRKSSIQTSSRSYDNVRIYPVLLAPCRVKLLSGRPLSEVFTSFVLRDPEVAALVKQALVKSPDLKNVLCGPNKWRVAPPRDDLLGVKHPNRKKRGPVGWLADPSPPESVLAAQALLHRHRILMSILAQGQLEAEGLPSRRGDPAKIRRAIWVHPRFYIDDDGDIHQVNEHATDWHDRLKRCWTAVVLSASAAFHVKPPTSDDVRSTTKQPRRRPVGEALGKALKQLGLSDGPGDRTFAQVAGMVAPYMPNPPKSSEDSYALEKAVSRYYKNLRR